MHIYIGSTSERKIAAVEKVVLSFFPNNDIILKGFAAASRVPETPWDRETYDGARNRALHVRREYEGADLCIGLESGLIERYGHIFEEAWSVVIDRHGVEYYGYSSGLKVPNFILDNMRELGLPHSETMTIIERDHGKLPNDTWGTYSGGIIARTVSLEESLRNAFIQVVAPEHSFYKNSMFTAVHHVAIICSNYERSKQFYTDVLGFDIIRETYRAERDSYKLDLAVGESGVQIELFSFPNSPVRASYPEACGLRHLAFAVENLEKAVDLLQTKGVVCEPVRIDELTSKRFTFFKDPDGLPLEMYEI